MAKVLILCPTFDHVDTLFASIASVRAQTFREWEMAVIGDGAPDRTFEILEAIAAQEPRMRWYRHPKSSRYGEIYRDPVIRDSSAEFVCHLGDDDLWMPNHLAEMVAMLELAEWANQAELRISIDGKTDWRPVNFGTEALRSALRGGQGVSTGINYVAYRRDAYLRLPEGWTCAPVEAGPSDKFMWRKFFQDQRLNVASSAQSTAIRFPSRIAARSALTPEQRLAEITPWLARIAEPRLALRSRRMATVQTRLSQLFALHGGADCPTVDDAFAAAGLAPVDAKVEPVVAVNGAPMITPLSDPQREEAWGAWAMHRAYGANAEDGETLRATLRDRHGLDGKAWRKSIDALAAGRPDAALKATEDFCAAYPDAATAFVLKAELLIGLGQREEAEPCLRKIEKEWPDHSAPRRLRKQAGDKMGRGEFDRVAHE